MQVRRPAPHSFRSGELADRTCRLLDLLSPPVPVTVVKMAAGAGFRVLWGGYLVVVRLGGRMAAWCGGVLWGFWLVSVRGAIPRSHCCQIRPLSLPFLGLSVCRAVSRLHCRRMRLDSGTVRGDILPSCDRPVARQPDTAVRVVDLSGIGLLCDSAVTRQTGCPGSPHPQPRLRAGWR